MPSGGNAGKEYKQNRDYDLTNPDEMQNYLTDIEIEYAYGCYDQKDAEACYRLAEFTRAIRSNNKKAGPIFKQSCDKDNHWHSCFKQGVWLLSDAKNDSSDEDRNERLERMRKANEPPQMPKDEVFKEALPYFDKACEGFFKGLSAEILKGGDDLAAVKGAKINEETLMGMGKGCQFAATLRHEKPDLASDSSPRKIEELYTRGCKLKNKDTCFELHRSYLMGDKWAPQNLEKAFDFATKGCDLDDADSCSNLSLMYKNGHGCPQSEQLFKRYNKKYRYLTGALRVPNITFNS